MGGVTISNVRRGVAQAASIGYWIGERYARQGLMSEAVSAVVEFAFEELALHRVEAACLPTNDASRRLLLEVGFRSEEHTSELQSLMSSSSAVFCLKQNNRTAQIGRAHVGRQYS